MKIIISILAGMWGALCVVLIALAGDVDWGTPNSGLTTFISVIIFHALAIATYARFKP